MVGYSSIYESSAQVEQGEHFLEGKQAGQWVLLLVGTIPLRVHVLLEKPLSVLSDEGDTLVAAG